MSLDDRDPPCEPFAGAPIVSDARRLRALTHPVRIALLGQLVLHGPLTAAEASELIGEPPSTCSFHFRQLAKYGVVEEAGGGKGRAKPWRMTTTGLSVTAREDPASQLAERALIGMVRERQFERYRTWLQTRASYPRRWRAAADDSEYVFYLTVAELEQLNADLSAMLVPRFRERLADPAQRPAGSVPVELLLFSYPMAHPAAGAQDAATAAAPIAEDVREAGAS
jgi:DNA-binding transcriptional ArsR family regulator